MKWYQVRRNVLLPFVTLGVAILASAAMAEYPKWRVTYADSTEYEYDEEGVLSYYVNVVFGYSTLDVEGLENRTGIQNVWPAGFNPPATGLGSSSTYEIEIGKDVSRSFEVGLRYSYQKKSNEKTSASTLPYVYRLQGFSLAADYHIQSLPGAYIGANLGVARIDYNVVTTFDSSGNPLPAAEFSGWGPLAGGLIGYRYQVWSRLGLSIEAYYDQSTV